MEYVLSVLAIYYITLVVTNYDGPAHIFIRLREQWAPGGLKELVSCFVCLSCYVSVPFAIIFASSVANFFLLWVAFAGASTLLFKLSNK